MVEILDALHEGSKMPTVGKFYVFIAAISKGLYILSILGVLASVVSAFYYLRIIKVMYFDVSENNEGFESWLNASIDIGVVGYRRVLHVASDEMYLCTTDENNFYI